MPTHHSATTVAQRIEALLAEREKHQSAISHIDSTLLRVGAALGGGGGGGGVRRRRRGRPPGVKSAAGPKPGRRRRRKFAVSGENSVLAFIKSHKDPTTSDVNKHWRADGRSGTADNALTKLVKEKKLKRKPIPGQRGSTFSLA
jgi:hypothetical protein